MHAAFLSLYLCSAATAAEVLEIWQGTLSAESVTQKGKSARGKRQGRQHDLTLRITRKGGEFTGEWIEGDRVLAIAGKISGRQMSGRPTSVKKGKWRNDVLDDLHFAADIKKDQMEGRILGVGDRRARGGVFHLRKQ
jgi:hypothetical protein